MAAKKLMKANVNVLGLVLSKMDSRRAYYYSNYRNYYESYYAEDVPGSGRRRSRRRTA